MPDLPYDALLFDLDGTLIDTESLALRTGMVAFAQAGHPVDHALLQGLVGKDEPTSSAILRAALPKADLAAIRVLWHQGFQDGIEDGLPLKPGAVDLLNATDGRRRAIVTSSGRSGAHRKLAIAGLSERFDLVISLDDVARAKPAPDPYLLAAERLGLSPLRCLVFEDSDTGAESGHRAGCTVVQVPDVGAVTGAFAHHLAEDILSGARMAGLLP